MMKPSRRLVLAALAALVPLYSGAADAPPSPPQSGKHVQVSGVYPHLCAFNGGGECGIGAVVPWAGKLWYVTYPPHQRVGSDDKLHMVDPATMDLTLRPESVGGTHANRLIHRESNQLVIGAYFIDDKGTVRTVDVKKMPGRYTATARHLADPAGKVYFVDMEGPVWEVDVKTLESNRLFVKPVPGWHSKGAYSGQGVLAQSNNGEHAGGGLEKLTKEGKNIPGKPDPKSEDAGVLAEWNGKDVGSDAGWKIISRRQHVEVTGPGGIYGNATDQDPLWSSGWDRRSTFVHVRDAKDNAWHVYRFPRASHTYDPTHGWYTEWPRIREVVPAQNGQPAKLMMTMHGGMFEFPIGFKPGNTAGLRQINQYLRYIPDFAHWNGLVVLGSDDTSIMQNPMAGISQSNLWFGKFEELANFGPAQGWGGVWLGDEVKAGQASDPYLLAGYSRRFLHLATRGKEDVTFTMEVDAKGDGTWTPLTKLTVPGSTGYLAHSVPADVKAEWMRLTPDKDVYATAYFHFSNADARTDQPDAKFASLATLTRPMPTVGGLVRPNKEKNLSFLAQTAAGEAYYEVDEKLQFKKFDAPAAAPRIAEMHKLLDFAEPVATADEASLKVTIDKKTYRLPRGAADLPDLSKSTRQLREVASERILLNLGGTFYEAPRSGHNSAFAADLKNLKPVATHNLGITDYCVWRGLLVLPGTKPGATPDGNYFKAQGGDDNTGIWFGQIDDLWRLGKPRGIGGPWKNTAVTAGAPSDPYLMTNFDKKTLTVSHDAKDPVTFTVEVDPANTGHWKPVHQLSAKPGEPATYAFPDGFGAYWVRVTADKPCTATATFVYE